MAEFCWECHKKLTDGSDLIGKYVISKELDLCEGCGEWKQVIVKTKRSYIIAEWIRKQIGKLKRK